jgi:carboxypeptidase C (cathepsin A)
MKAALYLLLIVAYVAYAQDDLIKNLPGLSEPVKFNQYAGYVNVNSTNGRNLFYWFVESQNDPKNDPVVLWMNGGPGCSSLDGLLTEHGPFDVEPDGKTLKKNPYAWNNAANVIYLESPAGVGFSYSENPKVDYTVLNDNKTAADVYSFLVTFFKKYPQFAKNPFYVSGESYAGHYVPVSANAIYEGNKAGKNPPINLKGFLVGNGLIDMPSDQNSVPHFIYHHAMTSESAYRNAVNVCKGDFYAHQNEPECSRALSVVRSSVNGVNRYNIYARCEDSNFMSNRVSLNRKGHPLLNLWDLGDTNGIVPCINSTDITTYLNNPQVQQAIHVKSSIKWEICSLNINMAYDRTFKSMLPFYNKLLSAGLRAIVYSGDIDMAVNSLGSEESLTLLSEQVGSKVVTEWQSWHVDGQVAGWYKQWSNNLTFLTIRGAGHMVPTNKPKEAYEFFTKFLKNEPF